MMEAWLLLTCMHKALGSNVLSLVMFCKRNMQGEITAFRAICLLQATANELGWDERNADCYDNMLCISVNKNVTREAWGHSLELATYFP